EFLLQIDDGVFWFLGSSTNEACTQPFVRVKGERAPFFLAKFSGLNDLIPSGTKWIPPIDTRTDDQANRGPLSESELEEWKSLSNEFSEANSSVKSMPEEKVTRFIALCNRMSPIGLRA